MPRYFLEISYKGTNYSGFQIQENANTIQSATEKALKVLFKNKIDLTGSSRTDAGVHAVQNFFHFDFDGGITQQQLYNLNAILPHDIVAKNIHAVPPNYHCRFDALAREYKYYIYTKKNPFIEDRAWFFPFAIDINILNKAAQELLLHTDFTSFSKKHTQVNNFNCTLYKSFWEEQNDSIVYTVKANRFLRGMVKSLVGTMLWAAREQITIEQFKEIITAKDCSKANFTPPSHGLFLTTVEYPDGYFNNA